MACAAPLEGRCFRRSIRSRSGKDVLSTPPTKMLRWLPGVIVTCLAFEATQGPITGASELNR